MEFNDYSKEDQIQILLQLVDSVDDPNQKILILFEVERLCREVNDMNLVFKVSKIIYELGKDTYLEDENFLIIVENLAIYYARRGIFDKALELNEISYHKKKEILGEHHEKTIISLANLANKYMYCKEYKQAIELFKKVYQDKYEHFGNDHISTLTTQINIAQLYYLIEDYQKSIQESESILQISREKLGAAHEITLYAIGFIIESLIKLNQIEEGKSRFENEIKYAIYFIQKKEEVYAIPILNTLLEFCDDLQISVEHTALYYELLADTNAHCGIYKEAVKWMEKAIVKLSSLYNFSSEVMIVASNKLGAYYNGLGSYKQAEEVYLSLIPYVENNPSLIVHFIDVLNNLSNTYGYLGDKYLAFDYCNRSVQKIKEFYGEDSEEMIKGLINLSACCYEVEKYKEGIEYSKQVYQLAMKYYGKKHQDTILAYHNLGNGYYRYGNYQQALTILEECYQEYCELFTKYHPETLRTLFSIVDCKIKLGKYEEAFKDCYQCLQDRKRVYTEFHNDVIASTIQLATCYYRLDRNDQAIAILEKCLETVKNQENVSKDTILMLQSNLISFQSRDTKKVDMGNEYKDNLQKSRDCYGEDSYHYGFDLYNYGNYLARNQDYQQAIYYSKLAYEKIYPIFKKEHPDVLKILAYIGMYYHLDGDLLNALFYYRQYFNDSYLLLNNTKTLNHDALVNYLIVLLQTYHIFESMIFKNKMNDPDLLKILIQYKIIIYDIELLQNNLDQFNEVAKALSRFDEQKLFKSLKNEIILDFYHLGESQYGLLLLSPEGQEMEIVDENSIEKLSIKLNSDETVYICPDGNLMNYPFESIFKNNRVIYLSSVKSLQRESVDRSDQDIMLFTDANYGRNEKIGDVNSIFGTKLQEVFISKYLSLNTNQVYCNDRFNKENVLSIKDPLLVHISTHGSYDDSIEKVLDRPSLVLSNYNTLNHDPSTYVTAQELYDHISLKGTELVYLDACETGLGNTMQGEGMYGFRRVLELKGCKYIISTLKSVDDISATIFSKVFYEKYSKYKAVEEAFFETKRYLNSSEAIKELDELYLLCQDVHSFSKRKFMLALETRIKYSKEYQAIICIEHHNDIGKIVPENWDYWILQKGR